MTMYRSRKIYDETRAARLIQLQLASFFGFSGQMMTLNAEELATLYHLPTVLVLTGPMMKSEEARRVGPPAGLPIYMEEGKELPGI